MTIKATFTLILFNLFPSYIFAQDSLYLNATISGEKYGDKFSIVENAGDVNGDGFDDLLVGAPGADLTVSYAGDYTKLFLGGAPFDTIADVKFESHEEFTQFGHSLAGKGDLNGDGYSDFVIGDYIWGNFQYGRIYIYYGSDEIDTIPDFTISGTPWVDWYNQLGTSIAIDGDVNGDGFDDIIVGAPMDDRLRKGKVYIHFGGTEMDTIYDVYLQGPDTSGLFSSSVAYAGDVNKDGYDDFLVGAPQWDPFNLFPSKAFLFYGGIKDSINFRNAVGFVGDSLHNHIGRWVGSLGDLNNDGYCDFGIKGGSSFFIVKGTSENVSFIIDTLYRET